MLRAFHHPPNSTPPPPHSLLRNPVTSLRHYRLYVINRLPNLSTLDFQKIKPTEREEAAALFAGAEGEKLKTELAKSSE